MKNYKKELELQTINNDIQAKMQTIGTVLDDIQSDMTKMGEDIDSGLAQHTVITEIQSKYAHLVLTTIYRSPSGTDENDKAVNDLITDLSSRHRGYNIIVGDFNHHIDWSNVIKPTDKSSQQFIKTMQDNFLSQHIMNQTRVRGQNEPHILDLVLTDDQIIDDIQYLSPLGKSDHAVLF